MTEYEEQRMKTFEEAVRVIKRKLESGEYPLEDAPCFCGASDDQEIKTVDRLRIPHRVVVCKQCSIARANPRMTQEAYESYYNNEYRDLTYRGLNTSPDNRENEVELILQHEADGGDTLFAKMANEDIAMPEVVVDFGCYMGGILDRFKEEGAETWGIEYNDEARELANARGHRVFKSLDELIAQGVKADLVVMQDVIEHLLDLNEVAKIRHILKPDAYLYVYTPGLFRTDPEKYWQLAHTFYFVATTLGWFMNCLGFHETYLDEDITSFWQYSGVPAVKPKPNQEWVEYIVDEASGNDDRRLPPFRGVCKFTKKLLYDNMRRNFAAKFPDIYSISDTKSGPVMIVGGGPSVDRELDTIINLKRAGVPLITIARMYPWCIEHGVTPDYVVSLDCSEEQEKGFVNIQKETTHLMATVTRPEILDKIHEVGAPIYVFDSRDDRKIKNLRRDAGYEVATVINSGGTVVITCISAAFNLGFKNLHIFGLDLMFSNLTQTHATGIAGESVDQRILTCTINDEDIMTTPSFIEFARQTLDLLSVAHNEGILEGVKIYGDSILNRMWDGTWIEESEAA